MARCYGCGKQGLFLKVRDGFCADCFPKYSKDTQINSSHVSTQSSVCTPPNSARIDVAKQYLNKMHDRYPHLPMVIDNLVAVHSYPGVYVSNVNHSVLRYMCEHQKYRVSAHIVPDGHIALQFDGAIVGFLNQKEAMCKDWLSSGDIVLCEFVSFRPGFERVAISFYRDKHTRLSNRNSTIQPAESESVFDKYLAKNSSDSQKKVQSSSPPNPDYLAFLQNVRRDIVPRPAMLNGIPMVYSYLIRVSYVDHKALYKMAYQNEFDAEISILDDGDICLKHNDVYLARLTDKKDIAADWIKKQLPYICQFTGFKNGEECVILHLYRDDELRLKQCQTTTAKLTSCTSEEKQDNIMLLEQGQKLFVEEDDDGKWYVRDVNYHKIGRLPAKFNRMYEDGDLRGMFFDHTETVENANGYEYEIPYVRFYY